MIAIRAAFAASDLVRSSRRFVCVLVSTAMVVTSVPVSRAQTVDQPEQLQPTETTPDQSTPGGSTPGTSTPETPPTDGESTEAVTPDGSDANMAATSSSTGDAPPTEFYQQASLKTQARDPERFSAGDFSESVEIQVPEFRGLEPKLALTYSSSGGLNAGGLYAGFIGVGWRLEGIPDIVRTAPINGAPRFDANDLFQLDGMDLLPCPSGSTSPGCVAGGTHMTKVESYQKIVFNRNPSDPTSTVTAKDGTRSIFKSISTWGTQVGADVENPNLLLKEYRWLLAERLDRNDNKVTYNYVCQDLPVCYPETISYNGTVITFRKAQFTDHLTKATGQNLAKLNTQLKRIEIRTSTSASADQKVRLYALTHETSSSTDLQRLKQVQLFGSDYSVTSPGGVVTGTSLPAWTFAYQDAPLEFSTLPVSTAYGTETQLADFDGDRKVDSLKLGQNLRYSSDNYAASYLQSDQILYPDVYQVADLNGDRLPDIIKFDRYRAAGGGLTVQEWYRIEALLWNKPTAVGNIDVTTYQFTPIPVTDVGHDIRQTYLGDFRGIGRYQILNAFNKLVTWGGSGFENVDVTFDETRRLTDGFVLDLDGDGKDELISKNLVERDGQDFYKYKSFHFNAGTNTFERRGLSELFPNIIYHNRDKTTEVIGDFNGDGVSEFVLVADDLLTEAFGTLGVTFSNGRAFVKGQNIDPTAANVTCPKGVNEIYRCAVFSGDLNGDGRSDLVLSSFRYINGEAEFGDTTIWVSKGPSGWRAPISKPNLSVLRVMDVNGDGKDDLVAGKRGKDSSIYGNYAPDIYSPFFEISIGDVPDLMVFSTTPTGGVTTVEYKPSSTWPGTGAQQVPFVTQTVSAITINDGKQ